MPPTEPNERAAAAPREAQGLRMAIRWGCPDPRPPEIVTAVNKLIAAERRFEEADHA
jgi:hypothetical protein